MLPSIFSIFSSFLRILHLIVLIRSTCQKETKVRVSKTTRKGYEVILNGVKQKLYCFEGNCNENRTMDDKDNYGKANKIKPIITSTTTTTSITNTIKTTSAVNTARTITTT